MLMPKIDLIGCTQPLNTNLGLLLVGSTAIPAEKQEIKFASNAKEQMSFMSYMNWCKQNYGTTHCSLVRLPRVSKTQPNVTLGSFHAN